MHRVENDHNIELVMALEGNSVQRIFIPISKKHERKHPKAKWDPMLNGFPSYNTCQAPMDVFFSRTKNYIQIFLIVLPIEVLNHQGNYFVMECRGFE